MQVFYYKSNLIKRKYRQSKISKFNEVYSRKIGNFIFINIDRHDKNIPICYLCDSKTTYIPKKGKAHWFKYKNNYFICSRCYQKNKDDRLNNV